jgi:hypothetical protein
MEAPLDEILRSIAEVGPALHNAGTFPPKAFAAIVDAARARSIRHSAETGSGASTLLFSHLSPCHTVFALDNGSGSVENVRRSPLLRQESVAFVEGPTQLTLPRHVFPEKLQLALIDGPHGYPFPDLEYYYLYPHLDQGALLILDDIHIPTVHNLFQFLERDRMFALDRVVHATAFFTRTDAPVFDPLGDGWWEQGYNAKPLARYTWRDRLRQAAPAPIRRKTRTRAGGAVELESPANGATVDATIQVKGTAKLAPDSHLWILARRSDIEGWWPQGGGPAEVIESRWTASATFGTAVDAGYDFEIAAVVVGTATHQLWLDWVARAAGPGPHAPLRLPPRRFVFGEVYRTVTRRKP